jgi:hypothetical protein
MVAVLQADFLSLGGTAFSQQNGRTSPLLVAVLASNAQTMSAFVSSQNLMLGLLGKGYTEDAVAQAVVSAAYSTLKSVDATDASKTLTNQNHLVAMYSAAYKALTCPAAAANRRRMLAALSDADLQSLFGAVAGAVSSTNTQVQQVVETAKVAAADPTSSTIDTSNLMVSVSKMAVVQHESLAADITQLATSFAANPSTAIDMSSLQNVSAGTRMRCIRLTWQQHMQMRLMTNQQLQTAATVVSCLMLLLLLPLVLLLPAGI